MTTSPDRPTDPFYHRHVPEAHGTAAGKTPWWGPSTSSVDWCEANYRHNERVAELWNTLSSIPLVLVMIYGLVKCHQHNIEWRFRLCYIALGVVGCGSVAFHATMTHAGQASDELAMIYGGLVFLHARGACRATRCGVARVAAGSSEGPHLQRIRIRRDILVDDHAHP